MKTISDLFELILNETNANDGMLVKYTFIIDTRYNWVSMYEKAEIKGYESKEIFNMESIATPEKLQQVYWTIYNNGRSIKQG